MKKLAKNFKSIKTTLSHIEFKKKIQRTMSFTKSS